MVYCHQDTLTKAMPSTAAHKSGERAVFPAMAVAV